MMDEVKDRIRRVAALFRKRELRMVDGVAWRSDLRPSSCDPICVCGTAWTFAALEDTEWTCRCGRYFYGCPHEDGYDDAISSAECGISVGAGTKVIRDAQRNEPDEEDAQEACEEFFDAILEPDQLRDPGPEVMRLLREEQAWARRKLARLRNTVVGEYAFGPHGEVWSFDER